MQRLAAGIWLETLKDLEDTWGNLTLGLPTPGSTWIHWWPMLSWLHHSEGVAGQDSQQEVEWGKATVLSVRPEPQFLSVISSLYRLF